MGCLPRKTGRYRDVTFGRMSRNVDLAVSTRKTFIHVTDYETLAALGPLAGHATSSPADDATQAMTGPVRTDGA